MSSAIWWAKGLLFENCSCQSLCRGHVSFKQRCDGEACIGHWGVHFTEGQFEDVRLERLNAVILYDAPPLMYEGNWKQRLYVDERANRGQRAALQAIFDGTAGGPWETLGRFVTNRFETRFRPIVFDDAGTEKRMSVPGILDTTVTAIRGADREGPAIISNLYNVIHGAIHVLARGHTRCQDDAFGFTLDKTHGLYSSFSWEGPARRTRGV